MDMTAARPPTAGRKAGEPVWELARLYPEQGSWTEEDYLELDGAQKILAEYTDGFVEVLPMPTWKHQMIMLGLLYALEEFIKPRNLRKASCAPLPFKLRKKAWREPDIVFVLKEHLPEGDYPDRVDLAIEIVSEDRRSHVRDFKTKRCDYAAAGISEYWIVDPQKHQITVLCLEGRRYVEHGVFRKGERATSVLLKGFNVDVDAVFAAAK
jgi:Uma2 family endonuclease